jgi:hypothetical protein
MDTPNPLDNDVFGKIIGHPQQYDQASESRVFRAVLYHCALVLGGPIVAFFGTKTLLLGPIFQWESEGTTTDVVSAIVAGSHYYKLIDHLNSIIRYRLIIVLVDYSPQLRFCYIFL